MFHARGEHGRLLAAYADAAVLVRWSLATGATLGGATTFEAELRDAHPILIRHRPLTIALRFGAHEWRWELTDLHVDDRALQGRASGQPVVFPMR